MVSRECERHRWDDVDVVVVGTCWNEHQLCCVCSVLLALTPRLDPLLTLSRPLSFPFPSSHRRNLSDVSVLWVFVFLLPHGAVCPFYLLFFFFSFSLYNRVSLFSFSFRVVLVLVHLAMTKVTENNPCKTVERDREIATGLWAVRGIDFSVASDQRRGRVFTTSTEAKRVLVDFSLLPFHRRSNDSSIASQFTFSKTRSMSTAERSRAAHLLIPRPTAKKILSLPTF